MFCYYTFFTFLFGKSVNEDSTDCIISNVFAEVGECDSLVILWLT